MNMELGITLLRIGGALLILVLMARKGRPMAQSIFVASVVLALSAAMDPLEIASLLWAAATDEGMFSLASAIASIYVLSGAMAQTGQTHRMMEIVGRALPFPKLELILFPSLVGLFPIPGGAIFTCPIVEEVAQPLAMEDEEKGLVNYWFRHVGELVTPLAPGMILFCSLGECSLPLMLLIGLPVCLWAIFVGYLFFLRRFKSSYEGAGLFQKKEEESAGRKRASFLWEGLPMIVALALVVALRFIVPQMAAGFCIAISFMLGAVVCLLQNHAPARVLAELLISKQVRSNLLIVLGIFFFKKVLEAGDMLEPLGQIAQDGAGIFLICVLAPLLCGILTGLFVGTVGICAPIIISILQQANLWDERMVWIFLSMLFCYIAELISPMHVCLVVTSEYFHTSFSRSLSRLVLPASIVALGGVAWFFVLHLFL